MRVNIANIVQEQAKMLHETNFDDKVRFVDFPLYKRKGRYYSALRSVGYLPNCFLKHVEK